MTLTGSPRGPVRKKSCTAPFLEMNKSLPLTHTHRWTLGYRNMRCASAAMKRASSEEMRWKIFWQCAEKCRYAHRHRKRSRCCQCVPLWTESTVWKRMSFSQFSSSPFLLLLLYWRPSLDTYWYCKTRSQLDILAEPGSVKRSLLHLKLM